MAKTKKSPKPPATAGDMLTDWATVWALGTLGTIGLSDAKKIAHMIAAGMHFASAGGGGEEMSAADMLLAVVWYASQRGYTYSALLDACAERAAALSEEAGRQLEQSQAADADAAVLAAAK